MDISKLTKSDFNIYDEYKEISMSVENDEGEELRVRITIDRENERHYDIEFIDGTETIDLTAEQEDIIIGLVDELI